MALAMWDTNSAAEFSEHVQNSCVALVACMPCSACFRSCSFGSVAFLVVVAVVKTKHNVIASACLCLLVFVIVFVVVFVFMLVFVVCVRVLGHMCV